MKNAGAVEKQVSAPALNPVSSGQQDANCSGTANAIAIHAG
jgi:hypothetical protein